MTVSGMFTQGWMDDPYGVTIVVNTATGPRATLTAGPSFMGALGPDGAFRAVMAPDQAFLAQVDGPREVTATVQTAREVQAQVSEGSGFRAILSCE